MIGTEKRTPCEQFPQHGLPHWQSRLNTIYVVGRPGGHLHVWVFHIAPNQSYLCVKIAGWLALDTFQAAVKWGKTNPVSSDQPALRNPIPSSPLFDRKPNPKTQLPTEGSKIGFFQEKREVGFWPNITVKALRDDASLIWLHGWYAAHAMLPDGEPGLELVFAAAQNALEKGERNKPGLFVRRIRDWQARQLYPIGECIADRAHARLKKALGYGAPRTRH